MKKQTLCISIVLLLISIVRADDENFDETDPETWDYSGDAVYANIDPDNAYFDWERALYFKVNWARVDDFSEIYINSIPGSAWTRIDQGKIPADKINKIPAEHLNVGQLDDDALQYATEEQIATYFEWIDLSQANPDVVAKVFEKEPYNFNLFIETDTQINYNPTFGIGLLTGDFPAYDPKAFPKDKYNQYITKDPATGETVVKIIPIIPSTNNGIFSFEEDISKAIILSGMKEFEIDEYGIFLITPLPGRDMKASGELSGDIRFSDGRLLQFKNDGLGEVYVNANGLIEGKDTHAELIDEDKTTHEFYGHFTYSADYILLTHPADGVSFINDFVSGISIASTDGLVVFFEEGKIIPANLRNIQNSVSYGQDGFTSSGSVEIGYNDVHILGESYSLCRYDNGKISATGKIMIENNIMAYEGKKDSSQFEFSADSLKQDISISSSEDGRIAELAVKANVEYGLGTIEFSTTPKYVSFSIENELGKQALLIDPFALSEITEMLKDPKKSISIANNLAIDLGYREELIITTDLSIYQEKDGHLTTVYGPKNIPTAYGIGTDEGLLSITQDIFQGSDRYLFNEIVNNQDSFNAYPIFDFFDEYPAGPVVLEESFEETVSVENYASDQNSEKMLVSTDSSLLFAVQGDYPAKKPSDFGNPTDAQISTAIFELAKKYYAPDDDLKTQARLIKAVMAQETDKHHFFTDDYNIYQNSARCYDDPASFIDDNIIDFEKISETQKRKCRPGDVVHDGLLSFGIMQVNIRAHPDVKDLKKAITDWRYNLDVGINILSNRQKNWKGFVSDDKEFGDWYHYDICRRLNQDPEKEFNPINHLYKGNAIAVRLYNGAGCYKGSETYAVEVDEKCDNACSMEYIDCEQEPVKCQVIFDQYNGSTV